MTAGRDVEPERVRALLRRRSTGFGGASAPGDVAVRLWAVAVVMSISCVTAGPGRRRPDPQVDACGLPALEPELLGLLLDVLVVEGGAVLGSADAGADLDGDLLECRSLDRGQELERRGGVSPSRSTAACRPPPSARRSGMCSRRPGTGRSTPTALVMASQPSALATNARNFLASSSLSPSVDLRDVDRRGHPHGQPVRRSAPGHREEADVFFAVGVEVDDRVDSRTSASGSARPRRRRSSSAPSVEGRRARSPR